MWGASLDEVVPRALRAIGLDWALFLLVHDCFLVEKMKTQESKNAKIDHGQRSTAHQKVEILKYLHYLLWTVDRGPRPSGPRPRGFWT